MGKTRVYLSGAISGTSDYLERFAQAETKLTEQGYSVVNPANVLGNMPMDTTYEEYMSVAFALLDTCDCIYMLSGWMESKGANREYGYALGKDMIIMMEGEE